MMKIAFVGLGYMGANMAMRLQSAGFSLVVNDLDPANATALVEKGAAWGPTPAACAERAEVLITSLPGPAECEAVMRGAGALAAMSEGATWIDMTTNRRELVLDLAREGANRCLQTIEAPVTGAVDGARRGQLTIFAAGAPEAIGKAQPVFDVLGKVIRCGELGNGTVVKLVTNLLGFIHATALGEALALGVKAGVDISVLWEAIKSSVGDSFIARHDAPSVFAGHYDPSFTVGLSSKDLTLTHELARSLGVPLLLGDCTRSQFETACRVYGGDAGALHVVKLVEDAAGVSLRLEGEWPVPWEA